MREKEAMMREKERMPSVVKGRDRDGQILWKRNQDKCMWERERERLMKKRKKRRKEKQKPRRENTDERERERENRLRRKHV